jgi:hypothetical protein
VEASLPERKLTMPNYLQEEGDFRIQIVEYGVKERDSGAVCISTKAKILDRWIHATPDKDGYWESWATYDDVHVYGDFYIVLSRERGNKLNDTQITALVEYCGWSGTLSTVQDGSWQPTPCQASVESNTYKDKTNYKMSWLNAFGSSPAGYIDNAAMKRIEAKHASAMRAIAGNVARNAEPPTGGPAPAPPAAPASPPPAPSPTPAPPNSTPADDNIPF